ncbi:MAG: HEAT repeat domain-containing protein [SAR324 cluster bacterium]|nr:HEAT repeat domain-containing protein [SAR324 cluster bacterium]
MNNAFVKLFNLEKGEGKLITLMILYSAAVGVPRIFTITTAQAYFLEKFDAQSLPYVYLFAAFINIFVGTLYLKLEQKLTFSKLLVSISVTLIVVEGCLNVLVRSVDGRWPALVLAIWNEAEFILLVMIFWALAGRVFDIRQGKRLFALIATGETLTGIVGGLTIPSIVQQIGTINLLFVSMGGLATSLFIFFFLKKSFPEKLEKPQSAENKFSTEENSKLSLKQVLNDRYMLMIFTLASCVVLVDYIVANAFFDRVTLQYPDKDALASFMGVFFAVNSFLGLLVGIFLSGRLLSKFGILLGLLSIPVTVGLHALPVSVLGTVAEPGIVIFWLMVSGRIFFRTCYYSLNKPTVSLLYQPFSANQRGRVQGIADSVVNPVATGVAGLLLLFLNKVLNFNAVQLCMVLVVISVFWGITAFLTRQEYTKRLAKALARRALNMESLTFHDSSSLAIVENALKSSNAHEVIYAIGMLEEEHPDSLDQYFEDLLNHTEPQVRQETLNCIERLHRESLLNLVYHQLDQEDNSSVKASAIRTLAALEDENVLDAIRPYLDNRDQDVQAGAIVGLLRHGGISGVLTAGAKLIKSAESSLSHEKRFAARVLGEVGIKDFYQPLINLLDDPELTVRKEAVLAAGKIGNPRLWPKIIKLLGVQELRGAAMQALVNGGESSIGSLEAVFNERDQSQEVQICIVQVMGKLKGEKALRFLRKNIEFPNEDVRHPLLTALKNCQYRCPPEEVGFLKKMIFSEVEDAAWAIAAINDLASNDFKDLVSNALRQEIEKNRERIFLLLSFLYDAQTILQAWQHIKNGTREKRTYALELIDNLIPQDLKQVLFPLLEEITIEESYIRLSTKFPQELLGSVGRLKEIIERSEQWTTSWAKNCALYLMGKSAALEFYDSILTILNNPSHSPLLLETAVWAFGQLNPDDLIETLTPLLNHDTQQVREIVQITIDQYEKI